MKPWTTLAPLLPELREHGEKPALLAVGKEEVETWSCARLVETALRFSAGLLERGRGRGAVVGLFSDPSPEAVAAALGTLAGGATLLLVDVQLADGALAHVLQDSRAGLILTTSDQAERLRNLDASGRIDRLLLDAESDSQESWRHWLAKSPGEAVEMRPEDPAALFYTSGTTGPPKGVPLSQANLASQVNVLRDSGLIRADDRLLLPLPLHHVYPFVVGLLAPLALGVPVVLPYALTGPQVLRAIRQTETSAIIGVPRLYAAMVGGIEGKLKASGAAGRLLLALFRLSTWLRARFGWRLGKTLLAPLHRQLGPRLRVLASGGSPLDADLARKLEGLGWPVANGYGLTETSPLLTIKPPDRGPLESVGLPVPGVEIRIRPGSRRDGEEPDEAPADEDGTRQGEVQARGPNVFAGYLGLADETAAAFTPDGWFRTGDLGYHDSDGYLYVTGRASTLIVLEGGENVQPDEVEQAYRALPIIREIGVLQRGGKLVAVIVPETDSVGDETRVEAAVRAGLTEVSKRLPSYQRLYDFVLSRQAIARTRLGKIQRHLLPRQYDAERAGRKEGAPSGPIGRDEMSDQDAALLEHRAARVVWEILAERYPDRRLSPDTSPQLELGIDSLTWLDLTMEISQRAGVELSEEALGRVQRVRDLLVEALEAEEGGGEGLDLADPESLISPEQKRWLRPLPWPLVCVAWCVYWINRLALKLAFRLRVEGLEKVPPDGPMVLAPNHVSFLDAPVLGASLPFARLRGVYWAAWTGIVLSNAFLRVISRLAQVLPIDPERGARSSLAFAAHVLKQGRTLIWFPEGHRSVSGRLTDFKPGLGMVLAEHPARIVPVHLGGVYEALPPGRGWPRFVRITVSFGEPVDSRTLESEGQGHSPHERMMNALRARLERMAE